MSEFVSIDENSTLIRSNTNTVRVTLHNGETMFAGRDILIACGILHPDRWMKRARDVHPGKYPMEKIKFYNPDERGCKVHNMSFVTAATGEKIVNSTDCGVETKKWLVKDVFGYRIETETNEEPQQLAIPDIQKSVPVANMDKDSLNSYLDRILIEVVEMKKLINGGAFDMEKKAM